MFDLVIEKIFIYVCILIIGYIGKRIGVFKKEYTKFLLSIICYITLPASIINGFQGVVITPILFVGLLVGLFVNTLLLVLGIVLGKNKPIEEKIIYIFSVNCFNIGNFAIPFLTGLISADGFALICIFDISVALMCYGVNVAIASSFVGNNGTIKIKDVCKKIFTSPVFITYVLLIILNLANIKLPNLVLNLTQVIGNSNAFISMLCIGILFKFKLEKSKWIIVLKVLGIRLLICLSLSLILYFVLPLQIDLKIALSVILLAPCAGAAPALTEGNHGDGSVAAVINSLSIPLSMILMSTLLLIL